MTSDPALSSPSKPPSSSSIKADPSKPNRNPRKPNTPSRDALASGRLDGMDESNGKQATDDSSTPNVHISSSGTMGVKTTSPASSSLVKNPSLTSSSPTKKRKRQSMFRIKAGCLVALRYRSEGNAVRDAATGSAIESASVVETWIDPTPGIDEGYMLMGQRVRCCFPKSVLSKEKGVTSRIVEGGIVGLVDLEQNTAALKEARRKKMSTGYIPVELLIDDSAMLPFLVRVDETVDVSKLSDKDRKRYRYEEIIRGKNKIIVRVNLADVAKSPSLESGEDEGRLLCKWVLRKRVAVARNTKPVITATPNGENQSEGTLDKNKQLQSPKTLPKQYVGNKHDSAAQQEQNWRWLARRRLGDTTALWNTENNLVGEVLKVVPSTNDDTLAMVSVKPLMLPENTERGRLPSQSPLELYDSQSKPTVQVPVEQLLIASRKIMQGPVIDGEGFASLSRKYLGVSNSWTLAQDDANTVWAPGKIENEDVLICHRCGLEGLEMLKDHLAVTPSAISCADCLDASKKFGKSGTFLKSCRCQQCTRFHASLLNNAFERSTEKRSRYDTTESNETNEEQCSVCCLRCKSGISCRKCGVIMHKRCTKWVRYVESERGEQQTSDRCRTCRFEDRGSSENCNGHFASACSFMKSMRFADFDLPNSYSTLHLTQISADKPITAVKPRGNNQRKKTTKTPQKKRERLLYTPRSLAQEVGPSKKRRVETGQITAVCKMFTCSRLLPYDPIKRRFEGIAKHTTDSGVSARLHDIVRNWRAVESEKKKEKKTASRAARANQRRMMKDVFAFGSTSLELDALAGRESHLRFDRSGIHAWGVFADQEIREGELLVEYRGEIIGNAMAEKREKEYEQAKIGSDYMFRIDGNSVCDATKQGNVARFINASCDPNCYTQIISTNNTKRIVIYAKKDIEAGQELCYDYKFPLEYDEEKRIPCHCSAKDCRGFMNWDKRYVVIPLLEPNLSQSSPSLKSAAVSGSLAACPDSSPPDS